MRFDRLDLIRFGKFTDQSISFPAKEMDFHVIVGPNEAGKSTVRSAVHDLLYGIAPRTAFAFRHPMPDLRIGAKLSHGGAELEFHRVKAQRNTLRRPSDENLSDEALLPFIGSTDKEFFTQMFGLDHERLVAGGSSILSSSNDLGQILFQSATGIQSLGTLRQALEDEAGRLWTKNKSSSREYYVAAEELDKAVAALKVATVRGKDWADDQARVTALESSQRAIKAEHSEVRARRMVLERIRRVTPSLKDLTQIRSELNELGEGALLPEGAAKVMTDAQTNIAVAQAEIDQQTQADETAKAEMEALKLDTGVRERAQDVSRLDESRLQFRPYAVDLPKREAEVAARWQVASELARSIGWAADSEDGLRKKLPSPLVRAELGRLVQERPVLQSKLEAAESADKAKREELEQARADLGQLTTSATPIELQTALQRAQQLGNFEARTHELRQARTQRSTSQESAFAALGQWRQDEAGLRSMTPPSLKAIQALMQDQISDEADLKAARLRLHKQQQQIALQELDINQYQSTHAPVTREEVLAARHARLLTWGELKAGAATLAALGPEFEKKVEHADNLADRSHETVKQASELASKKFQLERFSLELKDALADVKALEYALAARSADWISLCTKAGLVDLPLPTAETWLNLREQALAAAEVATAAVAQEAGHAEACNMASDVLAKELASLGQETQGKPLSLLVSMAHAMVTEITQRQGQRKSLEKQVSDAERALEPLAAAVNSTEAKIEEWNGKWAKALMQAQLAPSTSLAHVEATLEAAKNIEAALATMQSIRTERIDTMRADLNGFDAEAQELAHQLAPELSGQAADFIATKLAARLEQANNTHREIERLKNVQRQAQQKRAAAELNKSKAQATLQPLLQIAGVSEASDLAAAIERSEVRRSLISRRTTAELAIQAAGDGISMEHLQHEAGSIELAALLAELDQLTAKDEELVESLSGIASQLVEARTKLATVAGTADAAMAEAQRQEALAKMTDTVERYLKVYTGARLLKWSIERYREIKQGPMLLSASKIFSNLTLGSFERLSVDFDSEPAKLVGRRASGELVEVSGMSEGTRDQLYFSLRLAALELHLSQAHSLPFIADDLFINYDDERSAAGLRALSELSRRTQVLFLTHHRHLLPVIQDVFGADVNVQSLEVQPADAA